MAGRPSKPTELLLFEGKSHRTKKELENRKKVEQTLYTGETFKEQKQVKDNAIAHAEFLRLKRLYHKISYIDALDQQIINRYCLEISNQIRYQKLLDKLEIKLDDENIETSDLVQISKSISGVMGAIGKSNELLLKYEDRLFLNPSGRIKSVPKKVKEEKKQTGIEAFRQKLAEGQ